EGGLIEDGATSELVGLVEVGLPAQAVVDGEGGSEVPCVLSVHAEDVLAVGGVLRAALAEGEGGAEGGHLAGEEVGESFAGCRSAKGVAAVEEVAGTGVVAGADKLSADGDLVLADKPVDVVGEVFGI